MQLTFITDEATQSPLKFVELAKTYQIRTLELRTVNDKHIIDFSQSETNELKKILQDHNLSVCCIDSPVFKCDLNSSIDAELDKLKRSVEAALEFSAPIIRIFTFWRREEPIQYQQQILDNLQLAKVVVGELPIVLGIENGKRTMHSTGQELAQLFQHLDTSVFQIVWDPGNSIYGGTDADPILNGYPVIKEHMCHIHLKDPVVYNGGREYVAIGGGSLNVEEQIRQLVRDGYQGAISLETHWRPKKKFSEMELDYPGGDSFSKGGYQATHESLGKINDFIQIHA